MAANWLRTLALGPDAGEYWKHYRKYHAARSRLGRLYHSWRCQRICCIRGASIPVRTKIRGRITFPHGMAGVFLSQDAEIGEGCVIFQQVTIGSNTLPDAKRAGSPVIGRNVYIGAGAKIIGAVTVGDNCRIGANCVVFEDVPANSTVVLPRPRVIPHEEPQDNRFIPQNAREG